MIVIKKPKIEKHGDKVRLVAEVSVCNNKTGGLWIEVDSRYGEYLCSERSDAFVAGLMFLAIKNREDIYFEAPIPDELKDGIEHQFIDVLCQHQSELHKVRLIGPVAPAIKKDETVIGAGASCGVDCLYTIKRRIDGNDAKKFLLIANMHGHVADDDTTKKEFRFEYLKNIAHGLADDLKIDLIVCDTNFNSGEIPGLTFEGCTTYGNLFTVLSLQKLFSRYFIASGGPVVDFGKYLRFGIYGTDCSNYDLLTCQAFSTSSLQFIVDGLEDRNVKVEVLCDYPIAWKHLDVCHVHPLGATKNCTNGCPKCMYTILEIMATNKSALDKFDCVFNVAYVKSHMYQYAAELLRKRLIGAETAMETWPRRKNIGFTASDYSKASFVVAKKIFRKILRLGRTNHTFRAD